MNLFLDSFWRAVAYCFRPRIIFLSLLPFVLMLGLTFLLVFFFWDQALISVRDWLTEWVLFESLLHWLDSVGFANLRTVLVPLLVLLVALPVLVICSLLAVLWFMTPVIVNVVVRRRFPELARRQSVSWVRSILRSFGASLCAFLALLISMPLWVIPPLAMILPPLIWGWLTYRVLSFDVLADFASEPERIEICRRHAPWLYSMGVMTGFLGAVPGLIWVTGAIAVVFAPLLVPLAIWIYTFVFAFSALWFTHFCLTALAAMRNEPIDAVALQDERKALSL